MASQAKEIDVGILSKGVKTEHFALDIGSSSVKVLQLSKQGSNWVVAHIGQAPINRSIVADRNIVDPAALGEAIGRALKNAGIKTKNVYAAMPSTQATSKQITIPSDMSIIEQEDYMTLEAANHLPFPVEEVRMDFEILHIDPQDPKIAHVNLVAVKNEHFQNMTGALEQAGLIVDVMDVDEFAIERAIKHLIAQDPIRQTEPIEVVIDIGHEFTFIHVIKDGKTIYDREQSFGMKQLMDEVCRRFGLSMEEAQSAIANQKLPVDFVEEILPQFRQEVANQINRLIQFFFAATSYNRVHRIWISGGGGSLPQLVDEIANLTGVPTKVANPLAGLDAERGVEKTYLHANGASYLTTFGLAIRED